jgi:hypothetical protein
MAGWQELKPFPDAVPGLQRLRTKFKLVVLSNGEREFLAHLVKNRIRYDFDAVISVARLRVSRRLRQPVRPSLRRDAVSLRHRGSRLSGDGREARMQLGGTCRA